MINTDLALKTDLRARKNGPISFKKNISGTKLIFLTPKGHTRVERVLAGDYVYRNFNEARKGIGASDTHHYMIFRFLIEYLQNSRKILKITSFNNPSSKITTQIFGTEVFIVPDLTIYYESSIDFVEVDTGLEVSYQIYAKLIKYFSIIINKPTSIDIEKFNIYFSLSSKRSLYTLFGINTKDNKYKGKSGLVFHHFQKYSNTLEVTKNRSINISTADIIEKLNDKKVKIYARYVKDKLNVYSKVNLDEILKSQI